MQADRTAELRQLLAERILILDGAMGTMIQQHELGEEDYRGSRFAAGFDAQAAGSVGLRVQVNDEDFLFQLGQGGGQVDSRGGFSHSSFLVGDGDDFHEENGAMAR